MNLEEQKQAGCFNKDHKCLVREKCGELIRLSVLASILSFDWFLHYWPIKVNLVCFSTCCRLRVCLPIHSRVQTSAAFPQSMCCEQRSRPSASGVSFPCRVGCATWGRECGLFTLRKDSPEIGNVSMWYDYKSVLTVCASGSLLRDMLPLSSG